MELLREAIMPAYLNGLVPRLNVGLTLGLLSARYGTCRNSAHGYALIGCVLASQNAYRLARPWSTLALETIDSPRDRAAVEFLCYGWNEFLYRPFGEVVDAMREAFVAGRESGEPLYGGFCASLLLGCLIQISLPRYEAEREGYVQHILQQRHAEQVMAARVLMQGARCMQGKTRSQTSFDEKDYGAGLKQIRFRRSR